MNIVLCVGDSITLKDGTKATIANIFHDIRNDKLHNVQIKLESDSFNVLNLSLTELIEEIKQ